MSGGLRCLLAAALLVAAGWVLGRALGGDGKRFLTGRLAGLACAPLLLGVPAVLARLLGATATGATTAAVATVALGALFAHGRPPFARKARPPGAVEGAGGDLRSALPVAGGAGAVVALTLLANPILPVHSDAWFHAAVAARVHDVGVPPLDPYYAGLRLLYFWFFHVYVDCLATFSGLSPFAVMALSNVFAVVVFTLAVADLACALDMDRRAVRWAAVLGLVGVNPFGWTFMLARAATGETRGVAELAREILGGINVLTGLGWNFSGSLAFWADKFFVGTAFSLALPLVPLLAATLVRAVGSGATHRRRTAITAGVLACALAALHTVLALATMVSLGVAGCAAVAAARDRRNVAVGAGGVLLGATCGLAVTCAYLYCLLAGKEQSPLGSPEFNVDNLWTGAAAGSLLWVLCAVTLARSDARRSLRLAPARVAAWGWPLGTLVLAAIVPLPGPNENKFLYPALAVAPVLAAPAASALWSALARRIGRPGAWVAAALVLAPTPSIALAAEILDAGAFAPAELDVSRDEEQAYRWLRTRTPREAVLLDAGGRVDVLVRARRDVLWGGDAYAEQWGYPRREVEWRRRAERNAFAGGLTHADRAALFRLRRPVYVIARRGGPPPGPSAVLDPLFGNAEMAVYRVRLTDGARDESEPRRGQGAGRAMENAQKPHD
jgi:hypothetical protein